MMSVQWIFYAHPMLRRISSLMFPPSFYFFFCLNFFSVLFFRFHFFTFSPAWICEFSNLRALFFLIKKFLFSSLVRLEAALFLFCWCEQNTFLFARTNWFYFSDSLEKKTSLFIFFLHYAFSLDEATTMIRSCDGEKDDDTQKFVITAKLLSIAFHCFLTRNF